MRLFPTNISSLKGRYYLNFIYFIKLFLLFVGRPSMLQGNLFTRYDNHVAGRELIEIQIGSQKHVLYYMFVYFFGTKICTCEVLLMRFVFDYVIISDGYAD